MSDPGRALANAQRISTPTPLFEHVFDSRWDVTPDHAQVTAVLAAVIAHHDLTAFGHGA